MRLKRATDPSPLWLFLLGLVLALYGTHAGRYWNYTVDDAAISFAYARNLATGYGLVLTPGGERVEAVTNLLWCLLLAPASWLHVPHELLAKMLGMAGASLAIVCTALFPSVAYERRPGYYDLVAPLVVACMPHFVLWSVTGLENGLFAGLLVATLLAVAAEERTPTSFPLSSVLLVLLFATRPDGALYAAAVAFAKVTRRLVPQPSRQDRIWLLVFALGVGAIELFRLAYFAWPLPNSFYSKRRTFQFGQRLFDPRNAGWAYIGRWIRDYKLSRALLAAPFILLGTRAHVARIAAGAMLVAAFFLPIYAHGDWMEEYRFLSFAAPIVTLAIAEGVRAVARSVQVFLPRRARMLAALVLTPLAAVWVIGNSMRFYPQRIARATEHQTTEFHAVESRARYFVAAARAFDLDRRPALLDPDIGGLAYDGRLRIVDLFGLGDISIAHSYPDDPPGTREAIFWERRPDFIHLHGAWFEAMQLHRLEEMDQGYLRLPNTLPGGENESDWDFVRRESIAAPWYATANRSEIANAPSVSSSLDGYTLSHRAMEPGRRWIIEATLVDPAHSGLGSVSLIEDGGGPHRYDAQLAPTRTLLDLREFMPGERPRTRLTFHPAPGTYGVFYQDNGPMIRLATLRVMRGAGDLESRSLRDILDRDLAADRYDDALRIVRHLGLRVVADPSDAPALEGLAHYGEAVANRAFALAAEGRAWATAALMCREARAWAAHDRRTVARVEMVAERFADEARRLESAGRFDEAFALAEAAVQIDPRRSWSRRRAEALRDRRIADYDGGRDMAAYRFAAAALAGTADFDAALVFMGSAQRWTEVAGLAERLGREPHDPRARVALARGLLSRGEAREALGLVSGVPCASAHDPELTSALRVFYPSYRAGDAACTAPLPRAQSPFDDATGSFESGRFGRWTASGTAFGRAPIHFKPFYEQYVNGWRGYFFVDSFARLTEAARGMLRSPDFTIPDAGLSFLVGGAADDSTEGVRLVIDGRTVMVATGNNDEGLRRVFWDLAPFAGRVGHIEIFDESDRGHVLADDFRIEPVLPPLAPPLRNWAR